MAITFVYRSPYENPTGRYVKRLPDDSILAWFQRVWSSRSRLVMAPPTRGRMVACLMVRYSTPRIASPSVQGSSPRQGALS
jgi:hypothetical protein